MKYLLNRPLIAGVIMLLLALFLLVYVPEMSSGSIDNIHVPSTQTDNPVIALPVYLVKVLFALAVPLGSGVMGQARQSPNQFLALLSAHPAIIKPMTDRK